MTAITAKTIRALVMSHAEKIKAMEKHQVLLQDCSGNGAEVLVTIRWRWAT